MNGAKHSEQPLLRGRALAARLMLAGGIAVLMSGCMTETGNGQFGFVAAKAAQTPAPARPAPRLAAARAPVSTAEIVRGKVVVHAPRGYCIDRRSMRRGFTGGFALIAACNSLTGDFSGADVEPVVMTVQVQPGLTRRELPDAADLAAAMQPAKALRQVNGDGLTLVHLDSGGDRGLRSGDPKHWRGAMVINGYLVGLALYAPKGNALAGRRGQALIHRLAENLLDASLGAASSGSAATPKRKTQ